MNAIRLFLLNGNYKENVTRSLCHWMIQNLGSSIKTIKKSQEDWTYSTWPQTYNNPNRKFSFIFKLVLIISLKCSVRFAFNSLTNANKSILTIKTMNIDWMHTFVISCDYPLTLSISLPSSKIFFLHGQTVHLKNGAFFMFPVRKIP